MRYMFISDIHGALPPLQRALEMYRQMHCDMLLVLGDVLNYGPRNGMPQGLDAQGVAETLNTMADEIVAVRGNCDSEVDAMLLRFPISDTSANLIAGNKRILLTHGHIYGTAKPPAGRFHAICQGHTHLWQLEKPHDTVWLNTGSITFPKGGNPPTLATLTDNRFAIHTLQGDVLATLEL